MEVPHESLSDLIHVAVTGLIHIGPSVFHGVIVSGEGADANAQVYDGTNANAEELFHIEAVSKTTFGWRSTDGVLFHKGIYVVVNASTTHVMIEYHPIRLGGDGRVIQEV